MIRSEIYEAMSDASLYDVSPWLAISYDEGPASHKASKNAKEAVYIVYRPLF
jgi:hypothetical protein